jgi:hypothetical protein
MTVHGTIECRIPAGLYTVSGTSNANNEFFISLYNAFNNLSSIGVTRIAYNKGNGGTGMTYWDQGSPPGNGAWALFRFGNATIPFYVLIQGANLTTYDSFSYTNYSGCTPCLSVHASYNTGYYNNVSIAVAMRLDGTSPWGGTTVNTGTDTKTSPVWTPGSSTLAVFPRCNSVGGSQATNKESASCITFANTIGNVSCPNIGCRLHLLADENNFLIVTDANNDSSSAFTYFGKYVPRPGITPQIPYVMLCNPYEGNPLSYLTFPPPPLAYYGPVSYTGLTPSAASGAFFDGGIVHPTASNGVKTAVIDHLVINNYTSTQQMSPSRIGNGRFDMFPIYVGMFESTHVGILGTLCFMRFSAGMVSGWTSPDKKLVAFGNNSYSAQSYHTGQKLIVPWDGATIPFTGITRLGINF